MKKFSESIHAAEKTWDTINISDVRYVAWSSLQQIRRDVETSFSNGMSIHKFVADLFGRKKKMFGLALACGDMESERLFFESNKGSFNRIDGFDISSDSMNKYVSKTIIFNKNQSDLNYLVLPKERYALAVASHGAHHIYNLGNFFYQTNQSLKNSGLMYIYEWIGPNRLQIPMLNRVFSTLLLLMFFTRSERTTHMGNVKGRWLQYDPKFWEPTEACNSIELFDQYKKYFSLISSYSHGGLTYPIFEGIAQNLNQKSAIVRIKINFILVLEKVLTKLKVIKPLFNVSVGRKTLGVI